MSSAAKRARKKKLAHERQERELIRPTLQMDPADLSDPEIDQAEHEEVRFAPRGQSVERFTIDRPPANTTGDVDTVSTNIGTGSRPWILISPTGDPRGGLPDATTTDRDSPRLLAGGAHTTVQQQVLKLAGVVSAFPGGG